MRYVVTFLILFLLWALWSGKFDAFHLSLGAVSCALVTFTSHDLLFKRREFTFRHAVEVVRLIKYVPWLLYQILLSNIHVAYLALSPRMPIDPEIIKFKTRLKKDISMAVFANSITLTPGTITADIREGEYHVHALSKKVAEDLLTGEMENKVAWVFED